jgi:dihydroorotase
MPSRRRFLGVASGAVVGAALPRTGRAWQVPRYDLVVKGGTVIDPSQGIAGVRDIGILDGRVARVADGIPDELAGTVVDARGKLVTPGLIDVHVHVYEGVARYGIDPDLVGVAKGVTILVDGGSAGAITFPGFRRHVVEPARTRVYALLNIAESGMVVANETADLSGLDADAAARTIIDNRDVIVGLKVRMLEGIPEGQDLHVMRRAREAADAAGVPIMVHIGGQRSPLPRIVDLLRPGDVITHALRRSGSILDASGTIHSAVREAIARGVHLDVGHGRGNLDFDVAEAVLAQGVVPTVISSDVHRGNALGPVFDLPTTLSKFLMLGMSLSDVVRAATATPAQIFDFGDDLGTLRPGAAADVAIFELTERPVEFVDSGGKTRRGQQRLVPYAAILGGRAFGSINA